MQKPKTSQGRMRQLLVFGFAFILFLLIIVTAVALSTIFTLRDTNATVYQQITQAELARSLQYEIVAADHARDNYLTAGDTASQQSYQGDLLNIVQIESDIRAFPLTTTGATSLAIFDSQWSVYRNQNSLVFALGQNQNFTLARAIRPLPDAALHTLDGYITLATQTGDQSRAKAMHVSVSGPTLTVIVSLSALCIGALMAALLSRGIHRIAIKLTISLEKLHLSHAALEIANSRLEALATTDPLTALPNHRALVAQLDSTIMQREMLHQPCSFLFLDLDHFKTINDSYGHAAGDIVLCELAHIARTMLRSQDVLGRWGGEEFVAILPQCDMTEAFAIGERIRQAVATHSFAIQGGLHMTCSIGVACNGDEICTRDELVTAADQAMYAAKHLGRNQVRCTTDPAVMSFEMGQSDTREDLAVRGTVNALAQLIDVRDPYTGEHTNSVGELAMKVAMVLNLTNSEVRMIEFAGRLHDIGKIGIPDAILRNNGPLSAAQWEIMRTHPAIGEHVVSQIPALRGIAAVVRAHHERWDGQGYPDGLAGQSIPLGARIISVVDTFAAITTDRPYRQAQDAEHALAEIYLNAGKQFDPTIVQAFDAMLQAEDRIVETIADQAA